jgi:hypothetical protein
MDGARPLVEREGRSDLEIVVEEIMQDKITLEFDPTGAPPTPRRTTSRRFGRED